MLKSPYIANELNSPQAAINLQEEFQEGIDSLAKEPASIKLFYKPLQKSGIVLYQTIRLH